MPKYVSFFVPSTRQTLGDISPNSQVLRIAPNQPKFSSITLAPVSSGVAGRILDLGPVGIIALVAAAGAAGYLIVKAATR